MKQFQVCFFLRKDFECTKTCHKPKLTKKTKLSKQKATKATIFRAEKLLRRGNYLFCVLVLFLRSKYFGKTNRLEIFLIASFAVLLTCTPINPPYRVLICTRLCL